MKLTLEPTQEFFMAGDVMVRAWKGIDDQNQPVIALISAVAVDGPLQVNGLVSIPPPTADEAQAWARKIMGGDVDCD